MILVTKSSLKEKKRLFTRIYSVLSSQISYLLLLTAFFVLIELAFFVLYNQSYLYVFLFVSNKMQLPLVMVPGILFFLFAQLLVHVCFCLMVAVFASSVITVLNVRVEHHLIVSLGVLLAALVTVFLSNSYYFPNSHFSQLCSVFLSHEVMGYVLFVVYACWLIAVVMTGALLLVSLWQESFSSSQRKSGSRLPSPRLDFRRNTTAVLIFVAVLLTLTIGYFFFTPSRYASSATLSKPNIILVGVDSLRPDSLDFFGGEAKTDFMNTFLSRATVFSDAITPLARTYPSWVGILTGDYPVQSGVRTNLSGLGNINIQKTLPSLLRQQGYETLYATDEVRFSNIDKEFGFDSVLTPPVGMNDFLLGTFNDFPLSNLVVNTAIGRWLFPYSYANRAAYVTYHPNSFLYLVSNGLLRDHHKPLFLAIHFCLPHHPYLYDRINGEALTGQERYRKSIERVDSQVRDFFALIKQAGLLDHAVVVLLSDHGEALELAGDRLTEKEAYLPHHQSAPAYYPPSEDAMAMNQSVGHGTDVLGLPQYHSLLAFRLYGVVSQQARVVPGVVSLLDIKPTILQLVQGCDVCHAESYSMSLLPIIVGSLDHAPTRMLFLESDYSPDAVRAIYPQTRKLLLEGADLFQVDADTTRLTVKKQMIDMIIRSKQYAVINDSWMLAIYPRSDHHRVPVLINLRSGAWTTDLSSSFAISSPVQSMKQALVSLYGDELS